jgi:hypothetical protein
VAVISTAESNARIVAAALTSVVMIVVMDAAVLDWSWLAWGVTGLAQVRVTKDKNAMNMWQMLHRGRIQALGTFLQLNQLFTTQGSS